jgi:prepilin-type N-terminal cleavage/methylation domain-containing protein
MRLMRSPRRGFTLIEAMVTVVIVGVLATLAVVAFRKRIRSAKTSEAMQIIENIRAAQDAFKAETGKYANISQSLTSYYPYDPTLNPGSMQKVQWGAACTNCNANISWARINVNTNGPVFFGYATIAGDASVAPPSLSVNSKTVSLSNIAGNPWYVVTAKGDTDGNKIFTTLYATNAGGDLMIDNEGE